DFLTGKFKPGKKTAVIGGGGIGVDVAHKLVSEIRRDIDSYYKRYNISSYNQPVIQKKDSGRKTAVFRRNGKHGAGLGPTTFWALKQELEYDGVEFYQGLQYKEFKDGALIYETKDGNTHSFECDSVIICTGQESENSLAESLYREFPDKKIFVVGGARDAKGIDAKRAFQEGLEAAYGISGEK
ncbi:MAG TPA: FAD-dependent oxidoreductase, partial [Leptospiraceae bacterium]|nr:FAD-dependent oxidoreductase [Leptospiraceae bacterium]